MSRTLLNTLQSLCFCAGHVNTIFVCRIDLAKQLPVALSNSWSHEEIEALVEFILLMSSGDKWPRHKSLKFCESARQ